MKTYLPKSLSGASVLPEVLEKYNDYANYLIHLMSSKEFVSINCARVRSIFPNKTLYTKIKNYLIAKGIIECDYFYRKNEKNLGYRLLEKYANDEFIETKLTNQFLLKKLNKNKRSKPKEKHLKYLWDNIEKLDIDNKEEIDINELSLLKIKNKEIYVIKDEYGRIHTNITNLKTELRKRLKINEKSLINVDIKNSQPLMLGIALTSPQKNITKSILYPPSSIIRCPLLKKQLDFAGYLELCENGAFYDFLMDKFDLEIDRRTFKTEFFQNVFFCKNNPKNEYQMLFYKLFPSVYKAIFEIKKKDHSALAKLLQRVESSFVIDNVLIKCMHEFPSAFISTIHDSLLVEPDVADGVIDIFKNEFKKLGLNPILNVECYCKKIDI